MLVLISYVFVCLCVSVCVCECMIVLYLSVFLYWLPYGEIKMWLRVVTVIIRAYAYNDSIHNSLQFLNISFVLHHIQK